MDTPSFRLLYTRLRVRSQPLLLAAATVYAWTTHTGKVIAKTIPRSKITTRFQQKIFYVARPFYSKLYDVDKCEDLSSFNNDMISLHGHKY